jgi:protein SCO1/2
VGTALIGALAACGSSSSAGHSTTVAPPPVSLGSVANKALPASIRDIPLTKPDGTRTTLAAYQGQPVMIADYMTLCEDVCPMITANTVAMARALQADGMGHKVALLEITLDPVRDTPSRMRAYQSLYGAAPTDWTLLRAAPTDTAALWRFFGVYDHRVKEGKPASVDWLTGKPLTYDIEHSDALLFLDAAGRERFVIEGSPDTLGKPPPEKLVKTLGDQGLRLLHHPDKATDWTVDQGMQVFSWLTDRRLTDQGGNTA